MNVKVIWYMALRVLRIIYQTLKCELVKFPKDCLKATRVHNNDSQNDIIIFETCTKPLAGIQNR